MAFVAAAHFYAGRRRTPRVIGMHITATPARGPRPSTAMGVANYFARGEKKASAHVTVDDRQAVWSVDDDDTAFGIERLNADGLHIEHVGTLEDVARWARNPNIVPTLATSVGITAEWCRKHRLEPVRLTGPAIYGTRTGFAGHMDADKARGDRTPHGDPGLAFPWDWYLAAVRDRLGGQPTTPTPPPEEDDVPRPDEVMDEIEWPGGVAQLTYDGGVRFVDLAGLPLREPWPHQGPFSYPGLPEEARQGERGFRKIRANKRGGFRLVGTDGAPYDFPV